MYCRSKIERESRKGRKSRKSTGIRLTRTFFYSTRTRGGKSFVVAQYCDSMGFMSASAFPAMASLTGSSVGIGQHWQVYRFRTATSGSIQTGPCCCSSPAASHPKYTQSLGTHPASSNQNYHAYRTSVSISATSESIQVT
jgi:hypothetical protein